MIRQNYNKYQEELAEFSKNFNGNAAENTAKIVSEILERKKQFYIIIFDSLVRGMFDGRTDLNGMKI